MIRARDLLPAGKLQVDRALGLVRSPELRIYRMRPELGPPDVEEIEYAAEDLVGGGVGVLPDCGAGGPV